MNPTQRRRHAVLDGTPPPLAPTWRHPTCPDCAAPIEVTGKDSPRYERGTNLATPHTCIGVAMTQSVDDFLGLNDVPRDRWQRPLIKANADSPAEPYTRVSSFASALDDAGGLTTWKSRMAALAMARHPDLAALAASLVLTGDTKKDRPVNKVLDEHIETGICRVTDVAAYGTAIHAFTEPDASPFVPDRMQADVASYFQALTDHGLECVEAERFVVNDDLKVAGTFDGIYAHPVLGRLVGDKKTGKAKGQALAVQLACYAGAAFYDVETHERTPLGVRQDIGLLFHIPKGQGSTEVSIVDLKAGRAAAKAALWIIEWRRRDDLLTSLNPFTVGEYAAP